MIHKQLVSHRIWLLALAATSFLHPAIAIGTAQLLEPVQSASWLAQPGLLYSLLVFTTVIILGGIANHAAELVRKSAPQNSPSSLSTSPVALFDEDGFGWLIWMTGTAFAISRGISHLEDHWKHDSLLKSTAEALEHASFEALLAATIGVIVLFFFHYLRDHRGLLERTRTAALQVSEAAKAAAESAKQANETGRMMNERMERLDRAGSDVLSQLSFVRTCTLLGELANKGSRSASRIHPELEAQNTTLLHQIQKTHADTIENEVFLALYSSYLNTEKLFFYDDGHCRFATRLDHYALAIRNVVLSMNTLALGKAFDPAAAVQMPADRFVYFTISLRSPLEWLNHAPREAGLTSTNQAARTQGGLSACWIMFLERFGHWHHTQNLPWIRYYCAMNGRDQHRGTPALSQVLDELGRCHVLCHNAAPGQRAWPVLWWKPEQIKEAREREPFLFERHFQPNNPEPEMMETVRRAGEDMAFIEKIQTSHPQCFKHLLPPGYIVLDEWDPAHQAMMVWLEANHSNDYGLRPIREVLLDYHPTNSDLKPAIATFLDDAAYDSIFPRVSSEADAIPRDLFAVYDREAARRNQNPWVLCIGTVQPWERDPTVDMVLYTKSRCPSPERWAKITRALNRLFVEDPVGFSLRFLDDAATPASTHRVRLK